MSFPADFGEINPRAAYTVRDVAALFKVSEATVREWLDAGKLRHLPRVTPRSPFRILGEAILDLAGPQVQQLPKFETVEERNRRGDRAAAEFLRLMG